MAAPTQLKTELASMIDSAWDLWATQGRISETRRLSIGQAIWKFQIRKTPGRPEVWVRIIRRTNVDQEW